MWPCIKSPQGLAAAIDEFCNSTGCVAGSLLCFKSEIGGCRSASGSGDLLVLRAGSFLPCRNRVAAGRDAGDGVGAVSVGGRVWTFDHNETAVHPGMDVALHGDHFHGLPALLDGRRSGRLRLIPADIHHWIGQRMNVMGRLIAGFDLECLAYVHGQHMRRIHAVFLIEYRERGGCRGRAAPVGDIEDNILQSAIGASYVSLQVPGVGGVGLRTVRILRHVEGSLDRKSTRLNSSHLYISYAVL